MPLAFSAGFSGAFFSESCYHTGTLLYDDSQRKLRTDWMFGAPSCSAEVGLGFVAKADVNDAGAGVIRNYHLALNSSSYVCNNIQLPNDNWWSRDYLSNGTYLGQAVVQPMTPLSTPQRTTLGIDSSSAAAAAGAQGVLCDVFNTTGQFLAAYVLTCLPASTSNNSLSDAGYLPVRMEIWQGPMEDYYMDFTYYLPSYTSPLPAQVFDLFPGLPCT